MNTESSLVNELRDRDYRAEYVASQISVGLPFQVRALRKARNWTQAQLAKVARMAQPRIAEIESPGERKLNLETLLRLATAFDVALEVRFVPFSGFIDRNEKFDPNRYEVPTFDNELAQAEAKLQARAKLESALKIVSKPRAAQRNAPMGIYVAFKQAPSDLPHQPSLIKPDLAIVGGYEALRGFNETQGVIAESQHQNQWQAQRAG